MTPAKYLKDRFFSLIPNSLTIIKIGVRRSDESQNKKAMHVESERTLIRADLTRRWNGRCRSRGEVLIVCLFGVRPASSGRGFRPQRRSPPAAVPASKLGRRKKGTTCTLLKKGTRICAVRCTVPAMDTSNAALSVIRF